jgi:hypothetical protein
VSTPPFTANADIHEEIIMVKVRNTARLVLFLVVMTSFGQYLHAQERDRQITTVRSGMVENMSKPDGSLIYTHLSVVEIIGFSLAGVPITPGQAFRAHDDWLTKLRVKVKNISGASISHISMSFALPEARFIQDGRRYTMTLSLDYKAGARANDETPEMRVIQPGDEVELVCLIPLSEQIANKTGVPSITLLQYGGDVTAFFVNGSTWRGSNLPVGKE